MAMTDQMPQCMFCSMDHSKDSNYIWECDHCDNVACRSCGHGEFAVRSRGLGTKEHICPNHLAV